MLAHKTNTHDYKQISAGCTHVRKYESRVRVLHARMTVALRSESIGIGIPSVHTYFLYTHSVKSAATDRLRSRIAHVESFARRD